MHEDTCGVCFGNLEELNGAIELPCSCKVPYCQRCWDRTLATSLSNVGLPRCPSCREVIRVDYDASEGRLVFSRVADATVRFENWLETLDDILRQHSVQRCDEGFKFIARTQSGKLTKLFVMFAFQETWAKAKGSLWPLLEGKRPSPSGDWFVLNHLGEEVHYPREPAEEEFPVQVRYPKLVEHPMTELDANSFPLTLTFKEYVLNLEMPRGGEVSGGSVSQTFEVDEGRLLVREDVGMARKWKDQTTGVCLHPGDRILEVNGLQDVELIWEQLGCEELLKVRLQQQGSIFKTDVYNAQDDMRNRLQRQAKPRQQELLRRREHCEGAQSCVCGGELELLPLRQRVSLLVDQHGFLEYAGKRFSVDDLIAMQAVTCDLCHQHIQEEKLWTCQNGANTILHAQSYDVCVQCFNTFSESAGSEKRASLVIGE
ncbi:Hypothetical protein SCF082_LOCUS19641 [Durusdinium trenchii]|uniref:RING-type domain-containing protein n=1 Tax=Durusdinium trenchii TaxID=1381693 RepID=A0ABP0KXX4_9DINO